MRGFSKVVISGNLTRDPELRTTPSGKNVCSFSVAVNRNVGKDTENQVMFIDCSAWDKLADVINQYAKKGSGILVSGRLNQQSWEDKTTKQKRTKLEVVVDDFIFAGGGDGGSSSRSSSNKSSSSKDASEEPEVVPDDIPTDEGEVSLDEIPF